MVGYLQSRYCALFCVICVKGIIFQCRAAAVKGLSVVQSDWNGGSVDQINKHVNESSLVGNYMKYFEVTPELLKRKGGVSGDRKTLMLSNLVYVAIGLRRLFVDSNGLLSSHYNYEQVAVCQGHQIGLNLRNLSYSYNYFACPKDESEAEKIGASLEAAASAGLRVFCCGPPGAQFCCRRADFYVGFGSPKRAAVGLATKLIIAACVIVGVFIFAGCISLIVCLGVVIPRRRQGLAKSAPSKDPPPTNTLGDMLKPAAAKAPPYPMVAKKVPLLRPPHLSPSKEAPLQTPPLKQPPKATAKKQPPLHASWPRPPRK